MHWDQEVTLVKRTKPGNHDGPTLTWMSRKNGCRRVRRLPECWVENFACERGRICGGQENSVSFCSWLSSTTHLWKHSCHSL